MKLETTYLGLRLKHPIVPSASPLSETLDGILNLEDSGASAIVLFSLFEEQIEAHGARLHHHLSYGEESYSEALTYIPDLGEYTIGPDAYLELLRRAKERTGIPIIGSLNAYTPGGWTEYAEHIEQAGADALELNVYYLPTDEGMSGADLEQRYIDLLSAVRARISLPIAMKLSPYFSSMAHMARRLADAGANGLVLFNRFYQPDIDPDLLQIRPHLVLSSSHESRLPVWWTGLLYGGIPVDFAVTSGIHTHIDVLKALMAGARVTMMASELLRNGTNRITEIMADLSSWMETHEYESVDQMIGSLSQQHVEHPDVYERVNYMKELHSYSHHR